MRYLATRLVGLVALLAGASPLLARDCNVAAEAQSCTTSADCACGASLANGSCAAAARECLRTDRCEEFCGSFTGLTAVCRAGRCQRARPSPCAGDCDADAAVGIAELTIGVGVALGSHPLAACPALDVDRDGAATVAELVRAVNGALHGCTAILSRSPELRGYYDARLTSLGHTSPALATVYQRDEQLSLDIDQGPNRNIFVAGPLVDGHVTLSGSYLVTDIVFPVTGDATVASDADSETIAGSLASEYAFEPVPDAFVLRRSTRDDPSRLAGTWSIRFSESPGGSGAPSSATLRLEVARDGRALSSEGEDRDATGLLAGTLTTGECAVAPQGALTCSLAYLLATEPQTTPLRLTGVLAVGGTGTGDFLSGVDPPFGPYVPGAWSATRVP